MKQKVTLKKQQRILNESGKFKNGALELKISK